MATEEEVAAQRQRTDAARAALRAARVQAQMGGASAVAEVNQHKIDALAAEEAALNAELAALTGATEAPAPVEAPVEAPAEAPAEEAVEAPAESESAEDAPSDPSTSGTGRTRR